MALSPIVSNMALPMGRAWHAWRKPARLYKAIDLPKVPLQDHVIVAGYGRSGRAVARVLRAAGIPLLIVELNHSLFRDMHADGFSGVLGDITGEEILHAVQVGRARILLLTVPDQNTVHLAVERAKRLNSTIAVIARAVRDHHVAELVKLGVESAVQPEFEAGVEMVRQALVRYRYDDATTLRLLSSVRKEFYDRGGPSPLARC